MLRNILAVIVGIIIGSVVNMALVMVGPMVVPPPEGVNVETMEGLRAAMSRFEAKHFIFPFLAHSIGTLVGALTAAMIAVERKMLVGMVVGCFFLLGGIAAASMLGAPMWYNALDLIFAYIPMAWLGGRLAKAGKRS
ncbi:hypothetical protein [Leptolyngbya sp. 7M]|uniref:hypothetical protein n=1 Tax=Leptolyngbya sp. 7M TaxID=2812896 RepID=UPI001B8D57E1|nr:hypothetical protein [Leptolyngbya sp. 7M]QYO65990.1 hypothetical protein JVX88_04090 [Leptolyngbya sp. 7M]